MFQFVRAEKGLRLWLDRLGEQYIQRQGGSQRHDPKITGLVGGTY